MNAETIKMLAEIIGQMGLGVAAPIALYFLWRSYENRITFLEGVVTKLLQENMEMRAEVRAIVPGENVVKGEKRSGSPLT